MKSSMGFSILMEKRASGPPGGFVFRIAEAMATYIVDVASPSFDVHRVSNVDQYVHADAMPR